MKLDEASAAFESLSLVSPLFTAFKELIYSKPIQIKSRLFRMLYKVEISSEYLKRYAVASLPEIDMYFFPFLGDRDLGKLLHLRFRSYNNYGTNPKGYLRA